MLEAGHAPLPPQLDVHPHRHPTLPPCCQQLGQLCHILLPWHQVGHTKKMCNFHHKFFRFRRVLTIFIKEIFIQEVTEREGIDDDSKTEVLLLRRLR